MKAILDRALGVVISKKLTVFAMASIYLYFELITNEQWFQLAIVYIGTQATIDAIISLKKN
jgi:hypothetical protein